MEESLSLKAESQLAEALERTTATTKRRTNIAKGAMRRWSVLVNATKYLHLLILHMESKIRR